ncbi:MAG: DNA repair protein RecO [Deferrisomatales bacterium]|nr:DNA repair protein RecO [Deferrisomatales bacterium]
MRSEETEAYLLRSTPYGEADLIAVLFTRRWGRVSVLAKGARKSRRRFGGVLDYFHLMRAEVRPAPAGLGRLLGVELLRALPRLRESVEAYWAGTHVLEVARLGTREGDADEAFFSLLDGVLDALGRGAEPRSLTRVFQVRALSALGYGLPLQVCPSCGGGYPGGAAAAGGALRCPPCAGPGAARIGPGTLATLRAAQQLPSRRLGSLRFSERAEGEGGPLLEAGLTAALGRRPRSLASPAPPSESATAPGLPDAPRPPGGD